jgi:hypothetical protein
VQVSTVEAQRIVFVNPRSHITHRRHDCPTTRRTLDLQSALEAPGARYCSRCLLYVHRGALRATDNERRG